MERKVNVQQEKDKKKLLAIRIGVLSVIVLAVAGIFIMKAIRDRGAADDKKGAGDKIPLEITKVDLDQIKSYHMPFIIDFGSDSCPSCKAMAPVLVKLNKEWQGKAVVHFVDVWKHQSAANGFPVTLIPTQIFYNADGTPYVPSETIQKSIEFIMYTDKTTEEHIFTVHQGGLTEAQMRQIFAEMGVQ